MNITNIVAIIPPKDNTGMNTLGIKKTSTNGIMQVIALEKVLETFVISCIDFCKPNPIPIAEVITANKLNNLKEA